MRLPPLQNFNYETGVNLQISKHRNRFEIQIIAKGQHVRSITDLTEEDLKEINQQLKQTIDIIASNNDPESPISERKKLALAEVGYWAFTRIFSDSEAKNLIQELIRNDKSIIIEIVSESDYFSLPWELIYPSNPQQPISLQKFWGINHIICRVIDRGSRPESFVNPTIKFQTRPRFGLFTYDKLQSVQDKEIPYFNNLDKDEDLFLFTLDSLDPEQVEQGLNEFLEFWNNDFHLAHFACHAFGINPRNQSYIKLSKEFSITLMQMEINNMRMPGNPLVVLNACNTGRDNPFSRSNFADVFLKYGARGVVATECYVPDAFAADFAKQLYNHLLSGLPLGESLLAARRHFLEEPYNNPSGLLYSMYAPPSIQLVNTEDSNE